MKHVILTIVLLLASGLVIAQTKMSDVSGEQNIS